MIGSATSDALPVPWIWQAGKDSLHCIVRSRRPMHRESEFNLPPRLSGAPVP